jgi:Mg2+ and Co2+ transporter CorA
MNVDFPGFGSAAAFWAILGLFLTLVAGMLGFFRYKRWL